jgi:general secretion pathway protein F
MTTFSFEAARADGAIVRGALEASTLPDATSVLSARGLFPLRVDPARQRRFSRRPSARAQAIVFESLASLVETGIPLHHALSATERIASSPLQSALQRIGARVHEGASLGAALAAEESSFSGVAIGLVRSGERGMGLSAALASAAAQLEREADLAARIRAALAYPCLLALIGGVSVAVIVIFIVPRFASLLGELGQSLPTATRLLLEMSAAVRQYGVVLASVTIAGFAALMKVAAQNRARWDDWLLRLPVIGPIQHAFAGARSARTLGALLETGTPALVALEVAREAAGNAAIAMRLLDAKARVAEGVALSSALGATQALRPAAQQLAVIGDQSGRLSRLLAKAADLEDAEGERRLKTLVAVLEPALILLFAGVVAFVAAALLQAVYSLRPG